MQLVRPSFVVLLLLIFSIGIFGQSREYPNELAGYQFYGIGKLKNLKLLVSSKGDVKRVFGEKCEKQCDYDADWTVSFEYFEDIWITERRNENNEKQTYSLDPRYLGKLRSIEMRPKTSVSFANVSFPQTFQKTQIVEFADGRSGKNSMKVNDGFQDSSGLSYQIYGQTNYDDFKNEKTRSYNNGDLFLIRYEITAATQRELFVLEK